MTIDKLDAQLAEVDWWIRIAGDDLIKFYDPTAGRFWRSSEQKKGNKSAPYSATATPRCLVGLLELRRFLVEEKKSEDRERLERVQEALEKSGRIYVNKLEKFETSRHGGRNIFIDSQLLLAISLVSQQDHSIELGVANLNEQIKKRAESNAQWFEKYEGRLYEKDVVHHFITFNAIRALDAANWLLGTSYDVPSRTVAQVEADLVRSLAYHSAGTSKFDVTELVSETVLLDRLSPTLAEQFTESALDAIAASQSGGGGWPAGLPVSDERNDALYIPSYELALALADFMVRKAQRRERAVCEKVLPILAKSLKLVKSQHEWVDTASGWSNDHARRTDIVESWATAIVVTFLIHFRDALMDVRQQLIIDELEGENQLTKASIHWAEYNPLLRRPIEVDISALERYWIDPGESRKITRIVCERYLTPVKNSPLQRPSPRGVSMILYGDPGGGKTLLARSLARVLGWPFIMISTPTFLMEGLDKFEARAAEVFGMLLKLRRVVVLMDECEELFKARESVVSEASTRGSTVDSSPQRSSLESRTIGAFITSGMLTRLQKLHDNDWIIYLLNTNVGPDQLDRAATRLGRFDMTVEVPLPCRRAQREFVKRLVKNNELRETMQGVLEVNGRGTSFTILSDWIGLIQENGITNKKKMSELLVALGERAHESRPGSQRSVTSSSK